MLSKSSSCLRASYTRLSSILAHLPVKSPSPLPRSLFTRHSTAACYQPPSTSTTRSHIQTHHTAATSQRSLSTEAQNNTLPVVKILYGSQTGTAINLSYELAKHLRKSPLQFEAEVVDLAEFNPRVHFVPNQLVIFVMACFGHGEPTDNAKRFFAWLMEPSRLRPDDEFGPKFFSSFNYSLFGLGQSQHYPERYQQVAKQVEHRLKKLGAHQWLERGEGDDSKDIEADFESWTTNLLHTLETLHNHQLKQWQTIFGVTNIDVKQSITPSTFPSQHSLQTPSVVAPDKTVHYLYTKASDNPFDTLEAAQNNNTTTQTAAAATTTSTTTTDSGASCSSGAAAPASPTLCTPSARGADAPIIDVRHPRLCPVVHTSEVYASESGRSCVFIKFDTAKSGITYETGDYLGIFPRNSHNEVKAVAKRLKLDLQQRINVKAHDYLQSHSALLHIDPDTNTCTVANILACVADLLSPPPRSTLRALAMHATNKVEQEKLLFLASNLEIAKAEYQFYIQNERRTFLEVLNSFPSISHVTSDELVDILPPLHNRFYSICSSSLLSPNAIDIVASTVDFLTPTGRHHYGLCTRFLSERCHGDQVFLFVKQSLFRQPADCSKDIIMFAAGSGIAPFRAFVAERMYWASQGKKVGRTVLFFGCMNQRHDFLFQDELQAAVDAGVLTLRTAFSHQQPYRNFIQNVMIEPANSELIWSIIAGGGHLYVCGSAQRMAVGVHQALKLIVTQHGGYTADNQAELFLKNMKEKGVYHLDIF